MAAFIAQGPWSCLLDAAAGISDVVLQVAHHQGLQRGQVVIASDIFAQMLAITRKRAYSLAASLDFRVLDAHSMPDIQI